MSRTLSSNPGKGFLASCLAACTFECGTALVWSNQGGTSCQKPDDVDMSKASNTNLAEEAALIELPAHGILSPPVVHHGNPFLHLPQDLSALALRSHILQGHACSCQSQAFRC